MISQKAIDSEDFLLAVETDINTKKAFENRKPFLHNIYTPIEAVIFSFFRKSASKSGAVK